MRSLLTGFVCGCLLLAASDAALAQSVTRGTFNVIEEVQQLMEEERFDEAITLLEVLVVETKDNPYDHAIANQFLAHNSVMQDDVPRARSALQAALAASDLPPTMAAELKLFYGSVLLGDEEFALAAKNLEEWLAIAPMPMPKQVFTVAYANYMNGNLERAEQLVSRAIDEAGSTFAPDSWYQVYYRILFDRKKYQEGEDLLYELLTRKPGNPMHWRMLASHNLQLEESNEALAAMMLSYLNNQITEQGDLKQIVSLYGFIDIPEKAARLLETWIEEGKIEVDDTTRKQLGNLWLLAREGEKAKVALREAANSSPDGNTFAMLAGIYFEDEAWEEAHDAYREALRLGGLEEPLRISLLAGISAYRAGMMEEARISLEAAAESPDYRPQAESLLRRIDEA